jgi:hypothetical protein
MLVMGQAQSPSRSAAAAPMHADSAPSLRKAIIETWHTLLKDIGGTYHPERHYMRGPGPKWHAKHAGA